MNSEERGFEHTVLKGLTVKNYLVTILSTVSIVASVLTSYNSLSEQIKEQHYTQDTQNKVFELRLKILEAKVEVVQQQINEMRAYKQQSNGKHMSSFSE